VLAGSVAISKTTPLLDVTRGQLVPYTITVNNVSGQMLADVTLVDRFPAGFTYVPGSALLDGVPVEPAVSGRELRWNGLVLAGTQVGTLKLLLAAGAGITEGEYVNRAQVVQGVDGAAISGEATATVRVVPDPTIDCTGRDGQGLQRQEPQRTAGRGRGGTAGRAPGHGAGPGGGHRRLRALSHHLRHRAQRESRQQLRPQARRPHPAQRLPHVHRPGAGGACHARQGPGPDYGASIHRVVAIDLSDPAFEPGTTEIRVQWKPRLDLLLQELRKAPAVLRLSYVADTEDKDLVHRRLEAVKRQLMDAWGTDSDYPLAIEPEIFWRRGGPPGQPDARLGEGR
jgi:uncharacterized repeat protein (TIGR01451 family)